jgi:nucleolysin TIA-1/TIAR
VKWLQSCVSANTCEQWGKDRPPTTNFEGFSPAAAAAAAGGNTGSGFPPTPQGYGFPQYGAAAPMSPQGTVTSTKVAVSTSNTSSGPSPGGFQQPTGQFAGANMAAYGQMPQNGGGFGRGNFMGGPQGGNFGNYGGYQA